MTCCSDAERARAVRNALLPWFDAHRRDLPWRRNRTPYRVWLSELMLQQTRVEQAIPYFRRFMRRFPSVRRLATASLQDVLKAWEGLGYYRRARHVHQAAQIIQTRHNGRFPDRYEDIKALPGIGSYTAAAIASLAFGQDYAVVDGNVKRVVARWYALPDDVKSATGAKRVQTLANRLLVPGDAARYNEAVMELGATVCLPRNPLCEKCPMRGVCIAYARGQVDCYPKIMPAKKVPHKLVGAAVVFNKRGEVLIAQRRAQAMLGGLWEFPGGSLEPGETMEACIAREWKEELGVDLDVNKEPLMVVRHAYSHFTIALHVHTARLVRGRPRPLQCDAIAWAPVHRLREYPFSRADLYVVEKLKNHL